MPGSVKVCKNCGNEVVRYGSGNWWQTVGQTYDRCRNATDGKHEPAKVGGLSPVQSDALDTARAHGGRLVRWPGGFWTYPGCEYEPNRDGDRVPAWHVATNTVKGLVKRSLLVECEWRETQGFSGPSRFAVAVEVS